MFKFFYTYYGQKEMIPIIQAQGLHATIIDDGSPEPLGKQEGLDVYRIEEDIPWNIPGAKNLGFHVLDGWVLHLPIDHILTKEVYNQIEAIPKQIGEVYFIGSVYQGVPEPADQSPHDMVLIHKSDFEKIGGYDEDFAGAYGYEDGLFWKMCKASFKTIDRFDIMVEWHPIGNTKTGDRDTSRNLEIFKKKLGQSKVTTPTLNFKWRKL